MPLALDLLKASQTYQKLEGHVNILFIQVAW